VLFNEPKLLKCGGLFTPLPDALGFSALQRAEIAEIAAHHPHLCFNAPVSVLFNEPKLLKWRAVLAGTPKGRGFSALQRAEIAEIVSHFVQRLRKWSFSALQRAEIAEMHYRAIET